MDIQDPSDRLQATGYRLLSEVSWSADESLLGQTLGERERERETNQVGA